VEKLAIFGNLESYKVAYMKQPSKVMDTIAWALFIWAPV